MRRAAWLGLGLALAGGACDRKAPAPPAAPPTLAAPVAAESAPAAAASAPAATPAGCTLTPVPLRYAPPGRVVAVGDLHGDLKATRAALTTAGAIDAQDRWVGGTLTVVQTGDVLDRGDDEQAILDLFARLERDAQAAGGAFIALLGNHELMNAAGDLRYVTPGGLHDFDDAPGLDTARWSHVAAEARGRIAALGPGGLYAKRLAAHAVVAIVGDTVYSHAGVLGDWVSQVDSVNATARCWLDGQTGTIAEPPAALTADDGPVWTRAYGGAEPDCAALATTLKALGAARMVVGHTPQQAGITSACGGALWRIDVGLAAHYGGPIQVLEVAPAPKVLKGTR